MTEAALNARLDRLNERLKWISDKEARAAWFASYGSNGEFDSERERLIGRMEETLDELENIGGAPKFRPFVTPPVSQMAGTLAPRSGVPKTR